MTKHNGNHRQAPLTEGKDQQRLGITTGNRDVYNGQKEASHHGEHSRQLDSQHYTTNHHKSMDETNGPKGPINKILTRSRGRNYYNGRTPMKTKGNHGRTELDKKGRTEQEDRRTHKRQVARARTKNRSHKMYEARHHKKEHPTQDMYHPIT